MFVFLVFDTFKIGIYLVFTFLVLLLQYELFI